MKPDTRRLIIWHKEKHDDCTTTEVLLKPSESATDWIKSHRDKGGFWYDATKFIPWRSISYIELDA